MRNRALLVKVLMGVLMILVSTTQAATTTLGTTDDACIDQHSNWAGDTKGIPHLNWGWDGTELNVKIYTPDYGYLRQDVMLKWDVSSLIATDAVTDVTLKMAGWDYSDGPIDVYGIALGDWDETTVTWNNWVATTKSLVLLGQLTCAGPANAFGDTIFSDPDLTAWVQSWVDGSQSNYGLILKKAGTEAGGDSFSAHEDTWSYGHAPQLVITQVPEPATLVLLAGGLLSLIRRRRA
jgi:hypothetical protein